MQKIRVGICGFGLSGRVFHHSLISANSNFDIVAVQSSRVEEVKQYQPNAKICQNFEELCQAGIDLVIIGVPNHLHFDYATHALNQGIHCVVEKPFTVSSYEADQLIALAKQKSRMLTVFHNRRWDADFLTIQSVMKSGQLGRVVYFEAHFDRFKAEVDARWKEQDLRGGGVFYDLGSHLIDQAIKLFGTPKRVLADITAQRDRALQPDYFHLILDFGQIRAVLHAATLVANPGPRYQIFGTRGSFVKSGMDPQEEQLKSGLSVKDPKFGMEAELNYAVLSLVDGNGSRARKVPSERGQYQRFYEGVANCILNSDLPPIDPTEARDVIRVIEAGIESAKAEKWINF
jgi:scyllo-inositol 2-dehydrogenase (NADP+)